MAWYNFFDDESKFAIYSAMRMVITGVIGGLAIAIALILQVPIQNMLTHWNIVDETQNALLSILVYFVFAVIFVIILIPITKKEAHYKPD